MQSDQWYHFAFSLDEDPQEMNCYLDGVAVPVGSSSIVLMTMDLDIFEEITFGGTAFPYGSEAPFEGYVKEFRWWSNVRGEFLVNGFKNIFQT